jgi:pimeloyl-ACP methyl ester carboxylesterase
MKGGLKKRLMIWFLVLFGIYAGVCFALANMYRHPSRTREVTPEGFADIRVGTAPVWVIGPAHPKAVFVMCHGYGGSRYSWTDEAQILAKKGYRCYLPSMPGHGENPDPEVGFGVTESRLIGDLAKTARQPGVPVVGVGVSLGGSAIWLACDHDPTVFDAVATEGSFPSLAAATNCFLDRALPYGRITFAPVRWIAEWQSGVKTESIRPIDGAKKFCGKPALVIHGSADQLFPVEFGRELAGACRTDMWEVQGATHAYCYDLAPTEYIHRLVELADRCHPPAAQVSAR